MVDNPFKSTDKSKIEDGSPTVSAASSTPGANDAQTAIHTNDSASEKGAKIGMGASPAPSKGGAQRMKASRSLSLAKAQERVDGKRKAVDDKIAALNEITDAILNGDKLTPSIISAKTDQVADALLRLRDSLSDLEAAQVRQSRNDLGTIMGEFEKSVDPEKLSDIVKLVAEGGDALKVAQMLADAVKPQ